MINDCLVTTSTEGYMYGFCSISIVELNFGSYVIYHIDSPQWLTKTMIKLLPLLFGPGWWHNCIMNPPKLGTEFFLCHAICGRIHFRDQIVLWMFLSLQRMQIKSTEKNVGFKFNEIISFNRFSSAAISLENKSFHLCRTSSIDSGRPKSSLLTP